MNNYNHT